MTAVTGVFTGAISFLMMRFPYLAMGPALLFAFLTPATRSQPPAATSPAPLTVDQIVARMQLHDAAQSRELKSYQAIRHYQVQYHGLGTLNGKMEVQVNYDAVSGKSFRVISQSGSRLLCDKVLKRAVQSEKEASLDKGSTAVTPANYHFRLMGTEVLEGRPSYVLHVDPLHAGKFLYRGKIWVDAVDFAVAKIEVEPAKNPSFWITSTVIDSTNAKTDGVWLPQENRSQSKIRVGGTAILAIDYGDYHIAVATRGNPPLPGTASGKQLSDGEQDGATK